MAAPAFDAAGAGGSNSATAGMVTATWTHTATAGATVLVDVAYNASPVSMITGLTRTASYGGVAMTSLGAKGFSGAGNSPYTETFALANVPGGPQTVSISSGTSSSIARRIIGMSTSYTNVASIGTAQITNATSGTAASHVVTSAAGQLVHQVFGAVPAITAYNQTSRFNGTLSGASTIQVGDAAGAATVTFSATLGSSAAWASIAVPLIGSPVPLGAGSGSYGWIGTAVGQAGIPVGHGAGSYGWTATGRGKRTPVGHNSGGYGWAATARGDMKAHGLGGGGFGWAGTGVGAKLPKGHGAGTYQWSGVGRSGFGGSGGGSFGWLGAAIGRMLPRGSGTGGYGWIYQHVAGISLHRLTIVPAVDRGVAVPAAPVRAVSVLAAPRSSVVAATDRSVVVVSPPDRRVTAT